MKKKDDLINEIAVFLKKHGLSIEKHEHYDDEENYCGSDVYFKKNEMLISIDDLKERL